MSCVFCGGRTEPRKVTFSHGEGENFILIKNVPAEECIRCGERTYSTEITDELIKFAENRFIPLRTLSVPLFDFKNRECRV